MKEAVLLTIGATFLFALSSCTLFSKDKQPQKDTLTINMPSFEYGGDIVLQAADSVEQSEQVQTLSKAPAPKQQVITPKPTAKPTNISSQTATPQTQRIYVETDASQGRVWGFINMTGDKGYGTVFDQQENALEVTCERHGNELYATDHNSRLYVFKIKKQ